MAYQDNGFDEFLNPVQGNSSSSPQELDPLQSDTFLQEISGSKVQGGVLTSPDGRVKVDLDSGFFKVSNGVQDLVQLGILPDGNVGLLIKDNDGNILMQISGDTNLLQSNNKHMVLDFVQENLSITDEALTPIVLLGKLS